MPAVPVRVELQGATEFVLEVTDGGDGIGCDQADWAQARITLADGSTLWLDELPVALGPTQCSAGEPCFSFTYGGKPSGELLSSWPVKRTSQRLDDVRTQRIVEWTDPDTGLQVRCVAIEYHDYPTVEWTVYFKNTGETDTPILENIQAVDLQFAAGITASSSCTMRSAAPAR